MHDQHALPGFVDDALMKIMKRLVMMMVVVMPVGLIIAAVCKGRVTIMVMVTQTRSMTMMIMIF